MSERKALVVDEGQGHLDRLFQEYRDARNQHLAFLKTGPRLEPFPDGTPDHLGNVTAIIVFQTRAGAMKEDAEDAYKRFLDGLDRRQREHHESDQREQRRIQRTIAAFTVVAAL